MMEGITSYWKYFPPIIIILYYLNFKILSRVGRNSLDWLTKLRNSLKSAQFDDYGYKYKEKINELTKVEFDRFKVAGVFSRKKDIGDVSRGRMKLEDILKQTRLKVFGNVLSLACGRGGWEQVYAPSPSVKESICVTYGSSVQTPGHEDFTERPFDGKHKCKLVNMDIKRYHKLFSGPYDFVLFDGGESHANYTQEKNKFYELFHEGVMPAIDGNTQGFILKILTPFDRRVIADLQHIQNITGMGNFVSCGYSRQTNMELYFVSTKPPMNLEKTARALVDEKLRRAEIAGEKKEPGPRLAPAKRDVDYIEKDVKLLKPLNMTLSIKELGPRMFEAGRNFLHWRSMGVYGFGSKGGTNTLRVQLVWELIRGISNYLTNFLDWNATNTTPEGFEKVFIRKVDNSPKENSQMFVRMSRIYEGMANYMLFKGFKLRELSDDEVRARCNTQGSATVQDNVRNVSEFLESEDWAKKVKRVRSDLDSGTPTKAVFNTMGKREKKKGGDKGSRMIAFLPIPMRLLELKIFGNLLDLTKPHLNKFGVGGVGLHDFGMRILEVFKTWSCADDIAGFDTRVGLKILSLEFYSFIAKLIPDKNTLRTAENLYRVYGYPHIMIPMPSGYIRSELLSGIGQRMSGSGPTYAMNTITRLAIAILQFAKCDGIETEDLAKFAFDTMNGANEWNGLCSGDDFFVTSTPDKVVAYAKSWDILNELGFYRKDMIKDVDSKINESIEDTEFCSHHYEKVSYYDEFTRRTVERWQPTRSYGEIIAKSSIWISGNDVVEDQEAWVSAQGNNLIINYHHMRDCRRIGFAMKSVVNRNLILGEKRKAGYLPRPWMRDGQLLDIVNDCLFGSSTRYPVQGFYVGKWQHIGYMNLAHERDYEPNFFNRNFVDWRAMMPVVVSKLRRTVNSDDYLRYMDRYRAVL